MGGKEREREKKKEVKKIQGIESLTRKRGEKEVKEGLNKARYFYLHLALLLPHGESWSARLYIREELWETPLLLECRANKGCPK